MQTGRYNESGSFQEFLDQGNVIMPAQVNEQEEAPVIMGIKLSVLGVLLAALAPNVFDGFSFFGIFGGLLLAWGLFRLRKESGWFTAAAALGLAMAVFCAYKTFFNDPLAEDTPLALMLTPDWISGILGGLILAAVLLAIRPYSGSAAIWFVLIPVAYVAMFCMGFAKGVDLVLGVKATLGVAASLMHYKIYKDM